MLKVIIAYLAVINLFAFILFGADKLKAKAHKWRVSEKALFLSSILGGSVGALLGMLFFRHKTKHWYFRFGLPLILIVHIIICAVILRMM